MVRRRLVGFAALLALAVLAMLRLGGTSAASGCTVMWVGDELLAALRLMKSPPVQAPDSVARVTPADAPRRATCAIAQTGA